MVRLPDEIRLAKLFSSWDGKVLGLIHDDKLFTEFSELNLSHVTQNCLFSKVDYTDPAVHG